MLFAIMEILSIIARMIRRQLIDQIGILRKGYPAIAITGPRQSGKTTLAQLSCGAELPYVNFESPLERVDFAADPTGFFRRFPHGGILDEVQHVPDLLSFLQVRIDADRGMGRWILTGSQQLELGRNVSQTLTGRVSLLELLPLSYAELQAAGKHPQSLADAVVRGGYPAIYDEARTVSPARWLEDYLATFLNRDIRNVLEVHNPSAFDRFVRLCAARTGQILNTAGLARDSGIDGKTAATWLSVLEACYLIRLVRPYFRNFGKRLIKAPKLYFLDTGLACRLLHITDVNQAVSHPLWGALVENWCLVEIIKTRLNQGLPSVLWYWRTSDGLEVDVLIESGASLVPIEIKASATIRHQDLAGIVKLRALTGGKSGITIEPGILIYGGDERRPVGGDRTVPWNNIADAVPRGP
jgi:predicted AAA+ superfamily ATPase